MRSIPIICELNEIPSIAVQILEYGDGAVGGLFGLAKELDASLNQRGVISLKVVGSKEQENAAASLVADERLLMGSGGSGEKQRRRSIALGPNDDPPFVLLRLVCIFNQLEPQLVDVEIDGFVVVADHKSDMSNTLFQLNSLM